MTLKKQDQPLYSKNRPRIKCGLCHEQNVTVMFRDTDGGRALLDMHHKAHHLEETP